MKTFFEGLLQNSFQPAAQKLQTTCYFFRKSDIPIVSKNIRFFSGYTHWTKIQKKSTIASRKVLVNKYV